MPATSAVLMAFFSSFLLWPLTVLMKQTMLPVHTIQQSIYLDVYGIHIRFMDIYQFAGVNMVTYISKRYSIAFYVSRAVQNC